MYCNLLVDPIQKQYCNNQITYYNAVAYDKISRCLEIQNDDSLYNNCINEINQNLYDAAIEANDPNICSAIYNATMLEDCLEEIQE